MLGRIRKGEGENRSPGSLGASAETGFLDYCPYGHMSTRFWRREARSGTRPGGLARTRRGRCLLAATIALGAPAPPSTPAAPPAGAAAVGGDRGLSTPAATGTAFARATIAAATTATSTATSFATATAATPGGQVGLRAEPDRVDPVVLEYGAELSQIAIPYQSQRNAPPSHATGSAGAMGVDF